MRPLQKVLAFWAIGDSQEASDGGCDEARSGRSAGASGGFHGQGPGQQRATGEDRRAGGLGAVRAVAVACAARRERTTAVPGTGDVQGVVAAAVVRPVGSGAGGSAGRPLVVPPLLRLCAG